MDEHIDDDTGDHHCVHITGDSLTIDDVVNVARKKYVVMLSDNAKEKILASRKIVDDLVDRDAVVYGLTTGFGSLANVSISKNQTRQLQVNLIRSHAVGVGSAFSEDVVRATILIRANTLAKGVSGIRLMTVLKLIEMLNKNIYPYVPKQGSVGASGDLAPLSHIMLVLIGEGEVFHKNQRVDTQDILRELNFKPISLVSKEGLALNNGCTVLTAVSALVLADTNSLIKNAQITASATFEALRATSNAFDSRVHMVRPHHGQIICAENIGRLLNGSELVNSDIKKVQDCYSIRCYPQILGPTIEAYIYAKQKIEIEINSATDNPLIFDTAISGGNFHGQYIAQAMDSLSMALATVGSVSERRVARLVDPKLNDGLPAFLVEGSGLNSGFMIPPYTAASLAAENGVLTHPSCVYTIPTCANQEDHVSMGSFSSRKARNILDNVFHIVTIELLLAMQALDFREPNTGIAITAAKLYVRKFIPFVKDDCVLYKYMETLHAILKSGNLVNIVEQEIGSLKM